MQAINTDVSGVKNKNTSTSTNNGANTNVNTTKTSDNNKSFIDTVKEGISNQYQTIKSLAGLVSIGLEARKRTQEKAGQAFQEKTGIGDAGIIGKLQGYTTLKEEYADKTNKEINNKYNDAINRNVYNSEINDEDLDREILNLQSKILVSEQDNMGYQSPLIGTNIELDKQKLQEYKQIKEDRNAVNTYNEYQSLLGSGDEDAINRYNKNYQNGAVITALESSAQKTKANILSGVNVIKKNLDKLTEDNTISDNPLIMMGDVLYDYSIERDSNEAIKFIEESDENMALATQGKNGFEQFLLKNVAGNGVNVVADGFMIMTGMYEVRTAFDGITILGDTYNKRIEEGYSEEQAVNNAGGTAILNVLKNLITQGIINNATETEMGQKAVSGLTKILTDRFGSLNGTTASVAIQEAMNLIANRSATVGLNAQTLGGDYAVQGVGDFFSKLWNGGEFAIDFLIDELFITGSTYLNGKKIETYKEKLHGQLGKIANYTLRAKITNEQEYAQALQYRDMLANSKPYPEYEGDINVIKSNLDTLISQYRQPSQSTQDQQLMLDYVDDLINQYELTRTPITVGIRKVNQDYPVVLTSQEAGEMVESIVQPTIVDSIGEAQQVKNQLSTMFTELGKQTNDILSMKGINLDPQSFLALSNNSKSEILNTADTLNQMGDEIKEMAPVANEIARNQEQLTNVNQYATIAPYRSEELTDANREELVNNSVAFRENATNIANTLGINISNITENVGAYEGGNELSYTFELQDATPEQADMFASLMGELGQEPQKAVISSTYVDSNDVSGNANAIEIAVKVNDIELAKNQLNNIGIKDYSIERDNGIIKINQYFQDFETGKDFTPEQIEENLTNLLVNLQEGMGDNNVNTETNNINSRYLEQSTRVGRYEEWLSQLKKGNEEGSSSTNKEEIRRLLQQAKDSLDKQIIIDEMNAHDEAHQQEAVNNVGEGSEDAQIKIAKILDSVPEEEKKKGGVAKALKDVIGNGFFSHAWDLEQFADKHDAPQVTSDYYYLQKSDSIACNTLVNGRYKLQPKADGSLEQIGPSLSSIFDFEKESVQRKKDLTEYLANWRNVDSSTLSKRTGDKNLYVFGNKKYGEKESLARIVELEKTNPDFPKVAQRMWYYFNNGDLKVLQEYGILSEKKYYENIEKWPHYTPIQRNVDKQKPGVASTDANKTIKQFEGGYADIMPIEHSAINHTKNVYRSALTNKLYNDILDAMAKEEGFEVDFEDADFDEILEGLGEQLKEEDGVKYMVVYRDGMKAKVPISEGMYKSLSPSKAVVINGKELPEFKVLNTLGGLKKDLITGKNPFFLITNGIKDIQDAQFNTKYPLKFDFAYVRAWRELVTNGEFKKSYIANGASRSSSLIHTIDSGKYTGKNPFIKFANGIEYLNDMVEMAPRLAEYICAIEDGKDIATAMYYADEVTTNFGRGGDISKYMERNGFSFLNPSIQGFSKFGRNWKEAKKKGFKGIMSMLAKITLFAGVPLTFVNDFLHKGDEDYENLSNYVKKNYYILWKNDDGTFTRIPKGRIATFYQTVIQNGVDTVTGKTTLWEGLLDDYETFLDSIAPNSFSESSYIAPVIQAFGSENGTTWYGEDLVPTRLQNQPVTQQYDESTDAFSVWLGQNINVSPYKINYVIDQYSGVLGDVTLPYLTPQAENGIDNPVLNSLASPALDKFTTDPTFKNQNISNFYSLKTELNVNAKSDKATDEDILASKFINSYSDKMSDLYKQERAIQLDESLSNSEKYEKAKAVQAQIVEIAQTALASYDQMDLSSNYAKVGDISYYKNSKGEWTKMDADKSTKLKEFGLNNQETSDYYSVYNSISIKRDEIKEATPKGVDADYTQATIDAITSADIDDKTKNAVYDSYYASDFVTRVNLMEISDAEKLQLKIANNTAEGKKDENGKTISNSKALATADAYADLGLLDDVFAYIEANGLEPKDMGLSKDVYNSNYWQLVSEYKKIFGGYFGNGEAVDLAGGTDTTASKSSASKTKKGSQISSSVSTSKVSTSTASNNNTLDFDDAYSSIMSSVKSGGRTSYGQSTAKSNTSTSNQVHCPKCGQDVVPVNGRCPVCGYAL